MGRRLTIAEIFGRLGVVVRPLAIPEDHEEALEAIIDAIRTKKEKLEEEIKARGAQIEDRDRRIKAEIELSESLKLQIQKLAPRKEEAEAREKAAAEEHEKNMSVANITIKNLSDRLRDALLRLEEVTAHREVLRFFAMNKDPEQLAQLQKGEWHLTSAKDPAGEFHPDHIEAG